MSKKSVPNSSAKMYTALFLAAAFGFSFTFSRFFASNLAYLNLTPNLASSFDSAGSVAGISTEKPSLTVEVRTNNKALADQIISDLSSYKSAAVVKVSSTSAHYDSDVLVDMTDSLNVSNVVAVSAFENEVKIGATRDLPAGELSSDADVLLIVTTR